MQGLDLTRRGRLPFYLAFAHRTFIALLHLAFVFAFDEYEC